MAKKLSLFSVAAVIAGLTIAYQTHAIERKKAPTQISAQFEKLLMEHQKFVMAAYSTQNPGSIRPANISNAAFNFEKNFFQYTNFLHDANIQNFFRNIEADISRSGQAGYTMMSYTNFVMVNGQTHTIQYTYQSNGKDITLVKQTNENGNLLKSVYFYDINSQSLKADDYRENNIIHQKVYKI